MKKKNINTLEGVFVPYKENPKLLTFDAKAFKESIKKSNAVRGTILIDRLINNERINIINSRKEIRWYKRTQKRLNRLIKSKPKTIKIYQNAILNDPQCGPNHYIDVFVYSSDWKGKWDYRWITTFCSKEIWKDDAKDAKKYGSRYPIFNPEEPEEKFDQMYFNLPMINTPELIINCFKEWITLFLPDLKDIPVEYVEKLQGDACPWLKKLLGTQKDLNQF